MEVTLALIVAAAGAAAALLLGRRRPGNPLSVLIVCALNVGFALMLLRMPARFGHPKMLVFTASTALFLLFSLFITVRARLRRFGEHKATAGDVSAPKDMPNEPISIADAQDTPYTAYINTTDETDGAQDAQPFSPYVVYTSEDEADDAAAKDAQAQFSPQDMPQTAYDSSQDEAESVLDIAPHIANRTDTGDEWETGQAEFQSEYGANLPAQSSSESTTPSFAAILAASVALEEDKAMDASDTPEMPEDAPQAAALSAALENDGHEALAANNAASKDTAEQPTQKGEEGHYISPSLQPYYDKAEHFFKNKQYALAIQMLDYCIEHEQAEQSRIRAAFKQLDCCARANRFDELRERALKLRSAYTLSSVDNQKLEVLFEMLRREARRGRR